MGRLVVGAALLIAILLISGAVLLATRGQGSLGASSTRGPEGAAAAVEVRTVAEDLDTPWELAFAPDGRLFFTERAGRVRVIENGSLRSKPLISLPVRETAEGGLLGLAVDPAFPAEPYLYTIYTYDSDAGLRNRLVRLRVQGDSAQEDKVLLDGIPAASIHDGGRVKFGPDGRLYVTTGDAASAEQAQDPRSLAGKILRLQRDGSIPADNPFPGSPVYSLGHRNPEGLAWQPGTGRLYATEHGQTGNDEINLIEPGQNYGWPEVQGEQHEDFRAPLRVYSPAVAPAGAAFYDADAIPQWRGSFFFATLRGQHLHRVQIDPQSGRIMAAERLYAGEYGRLRAVVVGPDGALYVSTSNRDGRGNPGPTDDRILRIGSTANLGLLYPDLRTLPPAKLAFGRENIGGATHHVLRFRNVVTNAGEGPLELQEVSQTDTRVFQRIYDQAGFFIQRLSGRFVYHEQHKHWHFEDFARYELWTRDAYEVWVANGRLEGEPEWGVSKTSSCVMDTVRVQEDSHIPPSPVYPEICQNEVQGISVGWGDVYEHDLPEQWIDLGPDRLPDGQYVLRSVFDPLDLIDESEGGQDPARESGSANEGIVAFAVRNGRIAVES